MPVCATHIRLEPSRPAGDAPCPCCGHLLWFIEVGEQQYCVDSRSASSVRERLVSVFAKHLGRSAAELEASIQRGDFSFLQDRETDSLDVMQLVMEIEEPTA